ncbi:MAG: energy transducer TonB [Opitutaceae bacterium]|nr:energy transducer TonB [Opitutaceae bacterium]
MSLTKLQVGITSALAVTGAAGFALQAQSNAALRHEVASLRQENAGLAALRAENLQLARATAEVADLRRDDIELTRLNDEATAMKGRLQQVVRAEQARAAVAAQAVEIFNISQLDRTPTPRFQARPEYPAELRHVGVEGTVIVDFIVDANGLVRNARAIRSALEGDKAAPTGGGPGADGGTSVVKLSEFTVAGTGSGGAASNGLDAAQSAQLLAAAAVAAVGQWQFKPGQKGGRDVNTHMQIPIIFTLSDGKVLLNGPKIIAPGGATVFTPEGAAVIAPKP